MPQTDFYNHNQHRAFPLVDCEANDDKLLLDLRIILSESIRYTHGVDTVQLLAYGELPSAAADAWGATGGPVVLFNVSSITDSTLALLGDTWEDMSDAKLYLVRGLQWSEVGITDTGSLTRTGQITGHGVIGDVSRYQSRFTKVSSEYSYQVEPTCVIALAEYIGEVSETHVFNAPMTPRRIPVGCEHITVMEEVAGEPIEACSTIQGNFAIRGGTQATVRQNTASSQLQLGAIRGGGEGGIPMSHIDAGGDESDEDNAPRCSDVLRSLAGISGPQMSISGGEGVSVVSDPVRSRIIINFGESPDATPAPYQDTDEAGTQCLDPDGSAPILSTSSSASSSRIHCVWRAEGNDWAIVDYPCRSPTACDKPDRPPESDDEILTMPCLPVPVTSPTNPIRNGHFNSSETDPLAAWDSEGDVEVISGGPHLQPIDYPLVQMRGPDSEDNFASIRQNDIWINTQGLYTLQMSYFLTGGTSVNGGNINVSLTAENVYGGPDVLVNDNFKVTGTTELTEIVIGPIHLDRRRHSWSITHTGPPSALALVGFLDIVPQQ